MNQLGESTLYQPHPEIKNLQCNELTRRCSHFLLHGGFTINFCCVPLACALWMYNDADVAKDFLLFSPSWYAPGSAIKSSHQLDEWDFHVLNNEGYFLPPNFSRSTDTKMKAYTILRTINVRYPGLGRTPEAHSSLDCLTRRKKHLRDYNISFDVRYSLFLWTFCVLGIFINMVYVLL